MIIGDSSSVAQALQKLQAEGKLPVGIAREQLAKLSQAIQKYSGEVSERIIKKILEDWKSKIEAAQSMTMPAMQRGAVADLTQFVGSTEIADRIRFALKISQEVASGAGQYLNQNLSPEVLDEYPALEFRRLFSRMVPRGLKRGPKGAYIMVPEDNWPSRWAAAGEEAGDEDWVDWEGDAQGGRGVALKSSGIWQALGDGAGDYDDTLGNPFPPFAFNSGFMTFDVSRKEAVNLGLIGADDEAKPAPINFSKLFAEVAS
jgi:hypothetical protein